ncbi:MAG: hypothetical protein ABI914_08960, partial [Acidobacteriota bacterium]
QTRRSYAAEYEGFRFRMDPEDVSTLKGLPDFEGREEPAVAEDFLRSHAENWSDALTAAGAHPGEFAVRLDTHQRRARLSKGPDVIFIAEI